MTQTFYLASFAFIQRPDKFYYLPSWIGFPYGCPLNDLATNADALQAHRFTSQQDALYAAKWIVERWAVCDDPYVLIRVTEEKIVDEDYSIPTLVYFERVRPKPTDETKPQP